MKLWGCDISLFCNYGGAGSDGEGGGDEEGDGMEEGCGGGVSCDGVAGWVFMSALSIRLIEGFLGSLL